MLKENLKSIFHFFLFNEFGFLFIFEHFLYTFLDQRDFTVTGVQSGIGQVAITASELFVLVTVQHTIDGVAQERPEDYNITPSNFFNLQDYSFVGTTGTIIDSDSKLKICAKGII